MQSHFNSYIDNWNEQQNLWAAQSRLNYAVANTKVGQSITAFENFVFKEVPMSWAVGEFAALGWVASGAGKVLSNGVSKLFNNGAQRVFWSGGGNPAVQEAALEFAEKNGMKTLEMTRAGVNLEKLTKGLSWDIARPMWERLSAQFAKGAGNTVHVFQGSGGVGIDSVWGAVEYPILQQNGVNIIYHVIP